MPMAQGMGTRGRSAQKRTTERIQLRRIISFWGVRGENPGSSLPLGFGPVSMVCSSFIVEIS